MIVATAEIMRNIDNYCSETLRIPSIILMENAALAVLKNAAIDKYYSYVLVCGTGNNGGDALAVARHLHVNNKKIEVFLVGPIDKMSKDCTINYHILRNMDIKVKNVTKAEDINEIRDAINRSEVVIDGLFGTGLNRRLEEIYDLCISAINEYSKYTISIDAPSGMNSDEGVVLGNCVRANKTISFQLYKKGFLKYGIEKYTGEVVIENIGIPESVVDKFHRNEFIMDKTMVNSWLRKRGKYEHKGDFGKVMIIAGSKGFTGAAYISTEGAVKSGAGLVTLCCPEEIRDTLSMKLVEAMTISFDEKDKFEQIMKRCDAIAIGPGLGNNENTYKLVSYLIRNSKCPIVIDADGINVLKDKLELLQEKNADIIITPHFGEMARLTGFTVEEIKDNRLNIAKEFAKQHGVTVLLKGFNSVITDGNLTIVNSSGNSSMASGGMGDCLTGMITSFIGQGYKSMKAACIAAFIHGYCGEKLSIENFCVSASEVLVSIPMYIKEIIDCK
ncbi:MAG: NAD(P)H-hydrate dehydratase [Bacillota bacterium]|nr:NAD(P)H-hydrate dehydratase [Bacillota bacterium]